MRRRVINAIANYKTKQWKNELRDLTEKTGVTFDDVCSYINVKYRNIPGFYRKLPKTKTTYIGIGMAYKVPVSRINRWLIKYGGKKKLYVKECLSDLIWIYLINSCYKDRDSNINYYEKYEECRNSIEEIYTNLNNDLIDDNVTTIELENDIENIIFDENYIGLKKYVKENIEAFNSAYLKPKALLNIYIEQILRVKNENKSDGRNWTLNTLRGYLDDSMINYLTSGIKYVPKNKKTHISIGLALGMTLDDLNTYLDMMGYDILDSSYIKEANLIHILEKWNEKHVLQRKFKDKYIKGIKGIQLTKQEELEAVNDMLRLRFDLKESFDSLSNKINENDVDNKFPYLNE